MGSLAEFLSMPTLGPHRLLEAWGAALPAEPADRPLALLSRLVPEVAPEALARLSVGRRDLALLRLREAAFGPVMAATCECPGCRQRVEFGLTPLAGSRAITDSVDDVTHELEVRSGDYLCRIRLPDSTDLRAGADAASTRDELLRRCLTSAEQRGTPVSPDELPEPVVAAIAARMGDADPFAYVDINLDCPDCGHEWQAVLDPAAFFWSELNAWAMRLLRDVHTLATAYGWREPDVLALPSSRRQAYLNLIADSERGLG